MKGKILKFLTLAAALCGATAWGATVAKVGETEYETLEAAIAAAPDDGVVTVLDNIQQDKTLTIEGKDLTLDLNGKTLTVATEGDGIVVQNATLNLSDSGGTGKYVFECTASGSDGIYLHNTREDGGSILNINSNVEILFKPGVNSAIHAYGEAGTAVVNMKAGNVYANGEGQRVSAVIIDQNAAFNMKGGTFNLNVDFDAFSQNNDVVGVLVWGQNGVQKNGTVKIEGGSFNVGGKNAFAQIVQVGMKNGKSDNVSVEISGGEIVLSPSGNGEGYVFTPHNAAYASATMSGGRIRGTVTALTATVSGPDTANMIVSGGTFSFEVNKSYCADGFTVKATTDADGNTVYGVVEEKVVDFAAFVDALKEANYTFDGSTHALAQGGKLTVKWSPVSGCYDTREGHECTVGNVAATANTPKRVNSGLTQFQLFEGASHAVSVKNVAFVYEPAAFTVCENSDWKGSFTAEQAPAGQIYLMNTGDVTFEGCSFDKVVLTSFNCTGTSTVKDCSFKNVYNSYAVKDIRGANVAVTGCTFENCGAAVMVSSTVNVDAVTIRGNTFKNVDVAGTAPEGKVGTRGLVQIASSGDYADTAFDFSGNTATDCGPVLRQLNSTVSFDADDKTNLGNLVSDGGASAFYTDDSFVAQVGDTKYTTLAAALAALSAENHTLALLKDAAWNAETPVYWAAGAQSGYAATLTAALTAAYKADADAITIVCRPGADVGTMTHGHVADDLTIYGNNAFISDGECDLEVDTYKFSRTTGAKADDGVYLDKNITITAYELDNLGVWGERHTDYTVTVNLTDCDGKGTDFDGKGNPQRVYISGTTGLNNITLTGCEFLTKATAVYSNADGAITAVNCSFTGGQVPFNINHKANGTQTVAVENCRFTTCGDNGQWKQFAAPLRLVNSGTGTLSAEVTGCTFTDTVGSNGDILLGDGRKDQASNNVALKVSDTLASIQAQKPGYYVGETVDATKKATATSPATGKLETSVAQLLPVDPRTLGYATSGNAEALPAPPNMNGEVVNVTAAQAQYVLDGAYGPIDGKTINFTESINDTLILGRASKYDGSKTVYRHGSHTGEALSYAEFIAYKNQSVWTESCYYERTVENVTFTANKGVTVKNFEADGGAHIYAGAGTAPVYDYVRDTGLWVTEGSCYFKRAILKNITFKGLTFKAKTDINTSESTTVYDGFTFKDCTFDLGTTVGGNQAIRYYNENNNGNVKNLVVEGCTFKTCYQGVYTAHVKNVTVKDCTFDTTGHNAIAIQDNNGPCDHGAVVITGNKMVNIGDRAIRFNVVAAGTTITITRNTAAYKDGTTATDKECIKAETLAAGVTTTVELNNWNNYAVAANKPLTETVAKIGTTDYKSLEDATEAAQSGDVITIVGYTSNMTAPDGWKFVTEEGVTTLELDVITISTVEELVAFSAAVNGGDTFAGKKVVLAADIDLAGVEWKPIGNVASYPSVTFAGTFDGQNHVIANMKTSDTTPNYASAGLFGSICGTVKNVKLTNVSITSSHYAGGIVGYSSANGAVIENCHVDGGTIKSTPEKIGDEYDNGDKAGGIAGYLVSGDKVINCSVKNLTVTAYRDVGGLVGCSSADLSGNKVEDTTVVQSDKNGYKDEVITTFGEVCGQTLGGSNTDATTSNVTLDGPIFISTKEELVAFADAVNGGTSFAGKTVALTGDIDLGGAAWDPINAPAQHITFDGQGHKVSNFTVTGKKNVGFFGNVDQNAIKNWTIENATVSGINHVAALAGHGVCLTIENCHVRNSTITTAVENNDDGDKAGAIVGYLSGEPIAYVKNSTVENCTVKGYRDIGGAVGMANGSAEVSAVTVTGTTVINDRRQNYKNYTTDAQFDVGMIVGEANAAATIAPTVTATTTEVKVIDYVAQIGTTKYESLAEAVAAATAGQTVTLLKDLADTGEISLKAGVTLDGDGHKVTGNSAVWINKAGGTVQNVVFKDIHDAASELSAVYARGLAGTATITGCTFDNCDWDAIQATPVAGAVLTITGNVFDTDNTDGVQQQRYVHIESAGNVDFTATVTGNVMKGDTKQGALEAYYFADEEKIDVSHNYIQDMADVCILDGTGALRNDKVFPAYRDAEKTELYQPVAMIATSAYSADYYPTVAAALIGAKSGDTIQILAGTWGEDAIGKLDEEGKYTNANIVRYKSLTIQPAEGAEVKFTSTLSLGYDDSSTANATMTVKDLTFDGASLKIANYVQTTVQGCTFVNGANSAANGTLTIIDSCCTSHKTADAYPVSQVTVTGCSIDGSAAGSPGIRIRNSGNVTITGNVIKNTAHNGILFESNGSVDNTPVKTVSITDNTITEWDVGNVADGGRAMRLDFGTLAAGSAVTVEENVFRKETTGLDTPDFMKITGAGAATVSLEKNDWNDELRSTVSGNSDYYTVDTATPVALAAVVTTKKEPVAQIGETVFSSINAAFAAVNGQSGDDVTIKILKDVTEELTTDYEFAKNVTLATDVEGGVTLNFGFVYGRGVWALLATKGHILNIEEDVTITNLSQLFGGYYYNDSSDVVNVGGVANLQQLWACWGDVVNVLPTARIVMGYGDGMIKLRCGTLNVTGTKNDADDKQLTGGYITADNDGAKSLNLKDTYVSTSWLVNSGTGTITLDLDNATLELNHESSNGLNLGADATGTINMKNGSLIVTPKLQNVDVINVDATGLTAPVKVVDYTGAGSMTLADYGTINVENGIAYVEDNDLFVRFANFVAQIGETKYETLEDAVGAATDGDTIVLIADVDLTQYGALAYHPIVLENVTLDLDGHTITANNGGVVYDGDNAVIRNGSFVCANNGSYAMFVGNKMYEDRQAEGVVIEDVTCTGGINVYWAKVTIRESNMGVTRVSGTRYYAVWGDEGALIVVNGGEFTTSQGSSVIASCADSGIIEITGGTFTAPGNVKLFATEGGGSVSGGWFNKTVPEDVCAEGYVPSELTANGLYTVIENVQNVLSAVVDDETQMQVTIPEVVIFGKYGAAEGDTAEQTLEKQNAYINEVEANGLKVWQNYVMGVNGSDKGNKLLTDYVVGGGAGDGEWITVKTPIASFNPPTDSGITVKYRLLCTATPGNAKSWEAFGELKDTPSFPVNIAGQEGDTFWKIEVVFQGEAANE